MPRVSVIMSVYNGEKYLTEAIESILSQTFIDWEFIIINDGSTDKSLAIINNYVRQDQRIKIFSNEQNIGLTESLNKGIAQASDKYIARLDVDDISLPDRLERQVMFMENHPLVVILGTAYYIINEKGEIAGQKKFPLDNLALKQSLIKYNPFCHSSVILRRAAIKTAGVYREDFKRAQDYDLWLRLARKYQVANLPEKLIKKRYDGGNISISNEREQVYWALLARKQAIKRGQYPWFAYVYLLRPFLVMVAPNWLKLLIRKFKKSGRDVLFNGLKI